MAATMSWKFGIYNNGSFAENTSAHWFMDSYWTTSGNSGDRPCIAVTNNDSSPRILKSFQFSLINGSSGGQSFTSSNGNSHVTYASIATLIASVGSVSSNSVQLDSANGHFHYSSSAGQSYWGSRPTNASGTVDKPDAATDGDPIFYTFTFNSGISVAAGATVYILFTATWNTTGEHLIQIYPTKGIVIPVYHTVTWKPNGGNWSGSTADIVQHIEDGTSATKPSDPIQTNYRFTGWSPNDTAYTNVTSDLTYTAQWELDVVTCTFYRNHNQSDTTILKSGSVVIGTTVAAAWNQDNPTWSGYNFDGWATTWNGAKIGNNTQVTASQNKFYARWLAKTGDVKFYRNYDNSDNTLVATVSNVEYINQTLGSIKPSDPYRSAMYLFKGWSLSRDGNPLVDGTSLWDSVQDAPRTAFYAIWEKLYTVWVRENGVWVKKLNVRRYDAANNTWNEMPPKERTNGSWGDKS